MAIKYTKVRAAIECPKCERVLQVHRSITSQFWSLAEIIRGFHWCGGDYVLPELIHCVAATDGLFVNLAPYALDADGELSVSVAEVLGRAA